MTILIVEDDRTSRVFLRSVVEAAGHETLLCGDAESAWMSFLEHTPPIVLLDWMLPGMDGLTFCRKIRAHPAGRSCVVLMVTMRKEPGDLQAVLEAGADDYLTKPIDVQLFRVRLAVAEQQAKNLAERARVERDLAASQRFAESVLNSIGEGLAVIDREQRILLANPFLAALLDTQVDALVGQTCHEVLRCRAEPCRECPMRRTFETGEAHTTERGRLDTPDRRIDVRIDTYPIFASNGAVSQVICVFQDISERLRMEKEILDISAAEQRRIGQDLHDGLGQQLTGIAFLSKGLEQRLAALDPALAAEAGRIVALVNEAISTTRGLSKGLSPIGLEGEGLAATLQRMTANIADVFGAACLFDCDAAPEVDEAAALHLYRIAQEAINNALRHGCAKTIAVRLTTASTGVRMLSIDDDGHGLAELDESRGMGLRLMRYRASMINGQLEIVPKPGGAGTRVICVF